MFLKAKEHQHKLTFGSYVWSIRKLEKRDLKIDWDIHGLPIVYDKVRSRKN